MNFPLWINLVLYLHLHVDRSTALSVVGLKAVTIEQCQYILDGLSKNLYIDFFIYINQTKPNVLGHTELVSCTFIVGLCIVATVFYWKMPDGRQKH